VILSVTAENGRLFIQADDEPKQGLAPESPQDFYSLSSSDEFTFKFASEGPAVLQLPPKDLELRRVK
jgi:hypothetical protein